MKKTILIVDDFETTLFAVGMSLETQGYSVLKAGNAEEATKFLDGRPIHLVISDYNMPGMNGAELTAFIRGTVDYKTVPVLVLSTDTSPEKKKEAIKKGVTGWIKKPYKLDEFLKIVSRTVN